MKTKWGYFLILLTICLTITPTSCTQIPEIPQNQVGSSSMSDYLDDFGCFPNDCDLPPGMKELCEDYREGIISWPANCSDMPGEACQTLCETEKAASGINLPTEVVDAYQTGWTKPLQLDDNINDSLRSDFAWSLTNPVIDSKGNVLLIYSSLIEGLPGYYRIWDGEKLSEPQVWNGPLGLQVRAFDSKDRLHIISIENQDEEDQYLIHVIWDGNTFTTEAVFPEQFMQPTLGLHNLEIDTEDHLHLTFHDKSLGVNAIWYLSWDENGWSEPISISDSLTNSVNPCIALGQDGRVFISFTIEVLDLPVESATADYLFTYVHDGQWSEPIHGVLGTIKTDSRGYVHSIGENLYTYWDGERWSDPVQIEYPGYPTAMYHFVVDPQDNVTFIWNRYTQLDTFTEEGYDLQRELMTRRKYADGSWSPVMTLGVWDYTPDYNEVHTLMSSDADGVIHIGTSGNFEGELRQYYLNTSAPVLDETLAMLAVMPPQLAYAPYPSSEPSPITSEPPIGWSELKSIGTSSSQSKDVDIDLDAEGNLYAVWQEQIGDDYEILYSYSEEGSWSDPINISQTDGFDLDAQIVHDELGRLLVGWVGTLPGTTCAYSVEYDGTTWSTPLRLSKAITWEIRSSMLDLSFSKENVIRPSLAVGPSDEGAMVWEHISEGVSNTLGIALQDKYGWGQENIPIGETHFPYAGERADLDFDSDGNLHMVFTYSGNTEGFSEGFYLKNQPIYTYFDGKTWSEPEYLLALPPSDNPVNDMSFQSKIAAINADRIYVVTSLRPFNRAYSPYRRSNEDSNAYLTFWNGSEWSEMRRLDNGTAFGPSFADIVEDGKGIAHIIWSKYDVFSQHYSIYYTTSDGLKESAVIKMWESETEQDAFPILKPVIAVNADGKIAIAFEIEKAGIWSAYYTVKE